MKQKIITITTDFNDQFAAAQLESVAYGLGYSGRLIQNHSVSPFSIIEGAFQITTLADFCPLGTVHLGVIDPGVGSSRRGVIIKTSRFWFVGPDNGLLFLAARKDQIQKVWKLREAKVNDKASNTFHGRDIFIKAAVYLSQSRKPEEFGSQKIEATTLERLVLENGQIVHIDHYGNAKVHWPEKIVFGKKLKVKNSHGTFELPIVKTFSDVQTGQPLALLGSSNTLEIAINLGNAAEKYSLTQADKLEISYK